jgi:hypothetical protein
MQICYLGGYQMDPRRTGQGNKIFHWKINFHSIDVGYIKYPILDWECYFRRGIPYCYLQATPEKGVKINPEFDDNMYFAFDMVQAEALFIRFGLEKPPFIDEVINDLARLDAIKTKKIQLINYEYGLVIKKWARYATKVCH